jgi:hypothetical protein
MKKYQLPNLRTDLVIGADILNDTLLLELGKKIRKIKRK